MDLNIDCGGAVDSGGEGIPSGMMDFLLGLGVFTVPAVVSLETGTVSWFRLGMFVFLFYDFVEGHFREIIYL